MSALAIAVEEVVGNRLGSGVYRRWVEQLPLAGGERVLEVGCGAGACARHLAAAVPSGQLTCLDVDARWLEVARRRLARFGARVECVVADAAQWSRPDTYDVAVAHFVLHDIPGPGRRAALECIAGSLRPGGLLCLREPVTHGVSEQQLLAELASAGFRTRGLLAPARVPLMGEVLSGVWVA